MSYVDIARISIALVGIAGAFFAPWWLPAVCMVLLSLRWRAWEVPLLGLLIDFLWLPAGSPLIHVPLFTLTGLAIVWLFEPMRSQFLL